MLLSIADPTDPHQAAQALLRFAGKNDGVLLIGGKSLSEARLRVEDYLAELPPETDSEAHCLILTTSGSTGAEKLVVLSFEALRQSAAATHAALGKPGRWVTALPLQHIAGIQTVLRSAFAGHAPALTMHSPFSPRQFAWDLESFRAETDSAVPLYTSLVSAQLQRCLQDSSTLPALRGLDAILLGGGALSPRLLEQASDEGLRVVTTYGMTETAGGCVYDGFPLSNTRIALDDDGTILIASSALMQGYVDTPEPWLMSGGTRWLKTNDLGELEANGRLHVLGRNDELIKSGGEKINLGLIRAALEEHPLVASAHVYGRTDATWGTTPIAVIAMLPQLRPDQSIVDSLAQSVSQSVGRAATPRSFIFTEDFKRTGLGKPDGPALVSLAEAKIRQGEVFRR